LAAQALGYIAPHAPRESLEASIKSDPLPVVRLYAADSLGMQGGDVSEFLWPLMNGEKNRDAKLHMKYALERAAAPVQQNVLRDLVDWDIRNLDSAEVGKPAPDFELSTVDGRKIRLSDYRDKQSVVLVFIYGDT